MIRKIRSKTIKTPFLDHQILSMTTIIECGINNGIKSQGSGFFYNKLGPQDENKEGQSHWRLIEGTWLVTNRHVALLKINDKEVIPDYFIFNLRKEKSDEKIEWFPVVLTKEELTNRLKLHPNEVVDVAVIDVGDLMKKCSYELNEDIFYPSSLTSDNLPISSPIEINVTSDIVVASYPRGFYDDFNKFPILKSGIIASSWSLNFNGLPFFLIDAKLFPGSSGGLVISKPIDIALIEGKIMHHESKQFVFLGVYSGEPVYHSNLIDLEDITIIKKESFGLGSVWYSYLIPDIIENGVKYC